MMDKFNFFDIYGYLIPGGFWVVLLWLPIMLSSGVPAGLTAEITVAGLVAAYIAGHLLYGMARNLLPTAAYHDEHGEPKSLSYCLLATENEHFTPAAKRFSSPVREKLAVAVRTRFGIEISVGAQRSDAFYLCRAALAQGQAGAYVEQYQGLNALSRGLATACIFTAAYYVGWILAAPFAVHPGARAESFSPVVAVLLALALLAPLLVVLRTPSVWLANKGWFARIASAVTWLEKKDWFAGVASVLLLGALGVLAGRWHPLASVHVYQLAVIGALLWIAHRRFEIAGQGFDDAFAEAVFRDFVVFATAASGDPAPGGGHHHHGS